MKISTMYHLGTRWGGTAYNWKDHHLVRGVEAAIRENGGATPQQIRVVLKIAKKRLSRKQYKLYLERLKNENIIDKLLISNPK